MVGDDPCSAAVTDNKPSIDKQVRRCKVRSVSEGGREVSRREGVVAIGGSVADLT